MKINVQIEVRDDFKVCLDQQQQIEAQIKADKWSWNYVEHPDFKSRLKLELRQLNERLQKLGAFIEKGSLEDTEQWNLLISQQHAMRIYQQILEKRCQLLT